MKTKYVLFIVVALALLIGTVSGSAASGVLFDRSVRGDFDLEGRIKAAEFGAKAECMNMTEAEFQEFLVEEFESEAEKMNMTTSEYREYLAEEECKKFEAKAESMGMTVDEYNEYLLEQFEAKAESMGMTISEFKEYIAEQRNGCQG